MVVVWCSSRTGMDSELEGHSKWVSDDRDEDSHIKLLKKFAIHSEGRLTGGGSRQE